MYHVNMRTEVIGLSEAAELLGISYSTAKRLARDGQIPGQLPKIGSLYMVSRRGLEQYLNSYTPAQ